ncbi:dTDP-4-dehydrorhamnose 3,5-epimerase [Candidatus Pelagibacter sp.]|nr:dTDP-4-dehydrorhamnose 3,5-epimerase [Candidatus Pelagibacter sp.]
MQIIKNKFSGLIFYKRETFKDKRGYFRELFQEKVLKKKFVFDYYSLSKKNVLRGIHLQLKNPQGKLITVLSGKIFDVALDCRPKSKTFGQFFSIELSEKENTSLYIPEGFAHGFCSLTNNTILHYRCTNYRDKNSETGIYWKDKDLNINWPKNKFYISSKDQKNLSFKDFIKTKNFKKNEW